ncbi:MAG TPA: phosphate signaling complex protein PhoU [Chthoniobacterales bacterium]|jgi:phosphate transport system protein|nr:phosphate signaling complex protein PhoU [Chthoniobacterales bacterium]
MTQPKHTLTDFEVALEALRSNAIMMASLATRSLENALQGLRERNEDLCLQAIADDEEIDQLEMQMDKDGVDLLIRFQPVASDLRRVVSAMKLSPNLERIADESVSIARKARKLNQHPALAEVEVIMPLGRHAMEMFRDGVDAYLREDVELGRALKERDKRLDQMNAEAARACLGRIAHDPEQLRGYLNLMFIAGHLERIGDHATNIGEDAVYSAVAEDIRHQPYVPE